MIFFWLLGDVAKLVFYIVEKQPIQFVICAGTQVLIEIGIMAQFYLYKDSTETDTTVIEKNESEVELDPALKQEEHEDKEN